MSAADSVPDWLENFIKNWFVNPAAEFYQLKAGPPAPKAEDGGSRGLVVPGYKYLGPGNSLDRGKPVNKADEAAQRHDQEYDKLLGEGDNPYIKYNHADQEFQKELEGDTSLAGNAANAVFQAKKRVLEPLGLVEPELAPPGKKPKLPDQPEHSIEEEKTPVKRPAPESEEEAGSSSSSSSSGSDPQASGANIMAGGGGGPMADDNQGAEGVGNASGDWHCDTQWLGDHVLTKSTRTWVLPVYNNHNYIPVTKSDSGNRSSEYVGYSTPWGYFDFNRFHCHFSPRDWQRLINNHTGIRPVGLKIKVFNVQVKEVTLQDSTKTIANNLTSTVQIFADTEEQLPYVLGSGTEGTMPPFPNNIYQIPQYGYCTLQDYDGQFSDRSAFYCLEYFPSKMLRTGNNFEFTFKFEKLPFHSGWAQSQSIDRLMNPLLDQYLLSMSTSANGTVQYQKATPNRLDYYQKNWGRAPGMRQQRINTKTNSLNRPNMTIGNSTDFYNIQNRTSVDAPGFVQASTYPNAPEGETLANGVLAFEKRQTDSVSGINQNLVNTTEESEIQGTNAFGNNPYPYLVNNEQTASVAPTGGLIHAHEVMPGQVWADRDIYLQGPIWAKIPDTDGVFHPNPRMGGFGCKKPPPMILIKNTPVPADPPNVFDPIYPNSFITEYSTGQVTVEMLWEVTKENSKRWNPEIQFTSNYGLRNNIDGIAFGTDSTGYYSEPRPIGTRYISKHL